MSNLAKILTLNTRYISGSSLFHSHTSLIFIARPRELHTICNVLVGRGGRGKLCFFVLFSCNTNQTAGGRTVQHWPAMSILFSHCKYKLFEKVFSFTKHAPAEPLFHYGTMVKICFCTANMQKEGWEGVAERGGQSHTGVRTLMAGRQSSTEPQLHHGGPGHATFTH